MPAGHFHVVAKHKPCVIAKLLFQGSVNSKKNTRVQEQRWPTRLMETSVRFLIWPACTLTNPWSMTSRSGNHSMEKAQMDQMSRSASTGINIDYWKRIKFGCVFFLAVFLWKFSLSLNDMHVYTPVVRYVVCIVRYLNSIQMSITVLQKCSPRFDICTSNINLWIHFWNALLYADLGWPLGQRLVGTCNDDQIRTF